MNVMRSLRSRAAALCGIVIVSVALIGLWTPIFVTPGNLLGLFTDTSLLAMLVLAQMVVLIARGIDLSIASNLALTGMVATILAHNAEPNIAVILAVSAVVGCGLGLFNGVMVAFVGIPSIVVTLGTLAIYRGIIFFIFGNVWLPADYMPDYFKAFPYASPLGLPNLLVAALVVAFLMWLFLNHTRAGRAIYAVGGNPDAAEYCGMSFRRVQLMVFAISGTIAGICGYLWVARYGIAYHGIAQGYEFTVIAACVIGGISFTGGTGSVPSALLGALLLGVVVNALPVLRVSSFWQLEISGLVILFAVVFSAYSSKQQSVRARSKKPVGRAEAIQAGGSVA